MAEIDKALPNVKKRTTLELPSQDQITEVLAEEINRRTRTTRRNRSY